MASLSTHVLDTVEPDVRPRACGSPWSPPTAASSPRRLTDDDGRVGDLAADLAAEDHVLRFDTGAWFAAQGVAALLPRGRRRLRRRRDDEHYHVPLLLSPFGYSTYRGS